MVFALALLALAAGVDGVRTPAVRRWPSCSPRPARPP